MLSTEVKDKILYSDTKQSGFLYEIDDDRERKDLKVGDRDSDTWLGSMRDLLLVQKRQGNIWKSKAYGRHLDRILLQHCHLKQ